MTMNKMREAMRIPLIYDPVQEVDFWQIPIS